MRIDRWRTDNSIPRQAENLEKAFWLLYDYANSSRPILLILTALFYLTGFFMILIVFVQSVIEVIKWT